MPQRSAGRATADLEQAKGHCQRPLPLPTHQQQLPIKPAAPVAAATAAAAPLPGRWALWLVHSAARGHGQAPAASMKGAARSPGQSASPSMRHRTCSAVSSRSRPARMVRMSFLACVCSCCRSAIALCARRRRRRWCPPRCLLSLPPLNPCHDRTEHLERGAAPWGLLQRARQLREDGTGQQRGQGPAELFRKPIQTGSML